MANYDPQRGDLGYVRLLISDTQNGDARTFTDDEINAVLAREGNAKLAAAVLLLIIASNEALIAKAIRTQDLQTDGPKVAAEMRALAAVYREEGRRDLIIEADDDQPIVVPYSQGPWGKPELAEYPSDPFAWTARW